MIRRRFGKRSQYVRIHRLQREQVLQRPLPAAFDFHAADRNLERILA